MRNTRITAILTASALLLAPSYAFAQKAEAPQLKLAVGDKPYTFVYGKPIVENGNSLFPLRDLLATLGVTNDPEHINWDKTTQTITIKYNNDVIALTVGQKQVFRNGQPVKSLEVPAQIINGYTYIPARAVAESLSFKVGYVASSSTVTFSAQPDLAQDPKPQDPSTDNGNTAASATVSYTYMQIWDMMDKEPRKVADLIGPNLTPETANIIFDFAVRYREEAIINKLLGQKLVDPNHIFTALANPQVPEPTALLLSLAKTFKKGVAMAPSPAIIDMLLKAGAKPDKGALSQAVSGGFVDYVQLLLSHGANPNEKVKSSFDGRGEDSHLYTDLQWYHDRPTQSLAIAKLLLAAGAKPSPEEANMAMHMGLADLFEQMLKSGLDPNSSFGGKSLIQDAIDWKFDAFADLLMQYGAKKPEINGAAAPAISG